MKKNILNFIPLTIFLILISISIYLSSLFDLKQQQENEILYQRIATEQQIQKEAVEKATQKIYLLGKFDPSQREDFAVVPEDYSISGYTMYLRKEALDAFEDMAEAADEDEIELKVASATRNFDYQKNIWDNKWTGVTLVDGKNLAKSIPDELKRFQTILKYSATPGTSRHHWGTEIDINNANTEYFETKQGEEVYAWLVKNASSFGFCQPYTQKDDDHTTGYNEEKWHWSYLPLSKNFTQEYKNLITDDDIKGFDGDEYVAQLDLINNYVLGINPDCL